MLTHLSIQNYALIDKIEIDFQNELSIITGETGAGKSILLGALSLITGERADTSVLQDKTKKCIVEGTFDISNYPLKKLFRENELDYEKQTVIRREIGSDGKSRAFVNDTPVTLSVLRELGNKLIDIHSQHETLTLNDSEFQISVVDAFARQINFVNEYKEIFFQLKDKEKILNELLEQEKQSKRDVDYWQFQFEELEKANLQSGEQEKMEEELQVLNNAEEIKSALEKAFHLLNGGEFNLLSSLAEIKSHLNNVSKYNSSFAEIFNRLNSSYIELKDISSELESQSEKIIFDPKRAKELTSQLDVLYHLQKKHQVKSIEELLEIKNSIQKKLAAVVTLETQISKLKTEISKLHQQLFSQAKKISEARKKAIVKFQEEIKKHLASLALPNAQFIAEHILLETLTADGIDKIKFLFSANKGSELRELNKVASGGELSRLMLIIKSLVAKLTALPTIIFDEIDSGVSGAIADKVGKMISDIAGEMQVITITHLPQIASKGNSHFTVYKEENKNKTVTQIKLLGKEERVEEIAKMLSAGKPTDASVKNARELLGT